MGRLDHQVKIRGFRIELGEIELVLKDSGPIEECVAAVQPNGSGEPSLLAYIVLKKEAATGDREAIVARLSAGAKSRLPDYMWPSGFVFLDALPLTPNGKVDRKALKAPDQGITVNRGRYVAPTTLHERILTGIWSEVLKIERVGIDDDFFALGGNSMHVLQIVSCAGKSGLRLTTRDIFALRTVEEILKAAETRDAATPAFTPPPLTRSARRAARNSDGNV